MAITVGIHTMDIYRDLMGDIGEVDYSLTYSNRVSRRNIL
jgi:hypothetical protein